LTQLLQTLQNKNLKPKQKPILLKIAPDLTDEQLLDIIDIVKETKLLGDCYQYNYFQRRFKVW
jgi:dihydroorotate dehydrogenase